MPAGCSLLMTFHLVREIVDRGARSGPLAPLADQLNHDVTHLQGKRLESMFGQLASEVLEALARLNTGQSAAVALAQLPASVAGFTGRDEELAVLSGLRYDEGGRPDALSVEAAFELSYRRLGELEEVLARVFRLLPVNAGPDVSTAAAAALADLTFSEVRGILRGLDRAHLVEAAPGAGGRWRMHDLLRLCAQRLSEKHADADGREQARDRLLGFYLDEAGAADGYLQALPGRADWLNTLDTSLKTARRLHDRGQEGKALTQRGWALNEVRRFEEAIAAHQAAVDTCQETRDPYGEGIALENLKRARAEQQA
jgi:tetratricopeptide (TPR) repeat protein